MRRGIIFLANVGYGIITLLSIYAQPLYYLFALFAEFRLQLLSGGALLLVMGLWQKQRSAWILTLLALLLNINDFRQVYQEQAEQVVTGNSVRVMHFNTYAYNSDYAAVEAEITRNNPDIVFLAEGTTPLQVQLEHLQDRYPYHFPPTGENWNQLLFYSKLPVLDVRIIYFPKVSNRLLQAKIQGKNGDFYVIGIHTPSPTNAVRMIDRNALLFAVAKHVKALNAKTIVVGDHNATPFTRVFREYKAAAGLRNTQIDWLPYPTWPSFLPQFFGIPIDNALVTKDIKIVKKQTGRAAGSDHLPLIIDVVP